MPTYSNVHAHLDNSELHAPKDFSLADSDTFLTKNPYGELQWQPTYWQRPVMDLLDAASAPPAALHGDRYVLLNVGTTTFCGTTDVVVVAGTVDVDGTAMDTTAVDVQNIYGVCANPAWGGASLGDIVQYFAVDQDGNAVNQWAVVNPQEGYMLNNLTDGDIWRYNGSTWVQQASGAPASVTLAEDHTYAEMQALVATSALNKGQKYWVTDRDYLLEAVEVNQLSLDGDHTREIRAFGWVEFTVGTTGTSVDDVSVDGTPLLTGSIGFDTDLVTTAGLVADDINSGTAMHGYTARQGGSKIVLLAPVGMGSTANGLAVTAATTGITYATQDMGNGQDKGVNWFRIRYDFANDKLRRMEDILGNSVNITIDGIPQFGGFDPFEEFPWGYANVVNNKLDNGLLFGHGATGLIAHNKLSYIAYLNACAFTGALCVDNSVYDLSSLAMAQLGDVVIGNRIGIGSEVAISGSCSMVGNSFKSATFYALDCVGTHIEYNTFNTGILQANGYSGDQLRHNFCDSLELTANNATGNIESNTFVFSSMVTLDGMAGNFYRNECTNSTLDLTNCQSDCYNNRFAASTLSATNASGVVYDNQVQASTLTLDGFAGTSFNDNYVEAGSVFNASNSTAETFRNKAFASNVTLTNYTGTSFYGNQLTSSTLTAANATGGIDNNTLNLGTLEADNASGGISANTVNSYSILKLNGYSGSAFIKAVLTDNSVVNGDNSTSQHGALIISGNTNVDITSSTCTAYQIQVFLPDKSIKLNSTVVGVCIAFDRSNYIVQQTIDGFGVLDLDDDYMRFPGIVEVSNTGSIYSINGLATMPDEFILRPLLGNTITMDSSSAVNILFPAGLSSINMTGNGRSLIKFRKYGTDALILGTFEY